MTLSLHDAKPEDEADFRTLWQGFATEYGITLPEETTRATWARITDPAHRMSCRLALLDGQTVGFALYHHHCSSWVPGDDLYLEDLFVAPQARGRGVGRALIADLVRIGKENGWHRMYWNTEIENVIARKLYDSFCSDDGHIRYRMALR